MGTSLTALQAGSTRYVYVAAIEGFPNLLTNHGSEDLGAAWDEHVDFINTTALPGLFVDLRNEQELDPWRPFGSGGSCTLRVVKNSADIGEIADKLGVWMGRTSGGAQTYLTASIDRDAMTIDVADTSDFDASGTAYIGNECFAYSGVTATSFTGCTRGMYSPFPSGGAFDPERYSRHHRVSDAPYGSTSRPQVTQYRRVWNGAWVGVWAHRIVGSTLDTKTEAQLVFAGQIGAYGDEPSGLTIIHVDHVLDVVKRASLMRDQYRAKVERGCTLIAGTHFSIEDRVTAAGVLQGAHLDVKTSGSSGAYEIDAGFYTADQIVAKLNEWLAAMYAAATINGIHSFEIVGSLPSLYLKHTHEFPAAIAGEDTLINIVAPIHVAEFFGAPPPPPGIPVMFGSLAGVSEPVGGPTQRAYFSFTPIKAVSISSTIQTRLFLLEETGQFFDNSSYLPTKFASYDNGTDPVGVFMLDRKSIIVGYVDSGELVNAQYVYEGVGTSVNPVGVFTSGVELVQIAVIGGMKRSELIKRLLHDTGTPGYNTADDQLGFGLGLSLPFSICGDYIDLDADTMPGGDLPSSLWIVKPVDFTKLMLGDFIISGIQLTWLNGVMRLNQFRTPTVAAATLTLTEDNKAEPAGQDRNQRPTTEVDPGLAKPIVKIAFDFDPFKDDFVGTSVLEDVDALDGASVGEPETVYVRSLGQGDESAAALLELLPLFYARWLPYMSRPQHKVTRSIDARSFEGHGVGEIAIFTDDHARDPSTGERGVSARPALVIGHRYNPGGYQTPGANGQLGRPADMVGEVDLLVEPDNRGTIWSPSAEVDETVTGGGFTAGYNNGVPSIRCKAHSHSAAVQAVDASHFVAGDQIYITEIDPAGAPLQYGRTVISVSTNDIELSSTLAAFDTAKKYRVTSRAYATAVATQQTDAYQADDADSRIQNLAPPYHYALSGPTGVTVTEPAHTELAELDPTGICAGDGVALDTGYHLALAKTVNNFIDHKSAQQGPNLTGIVIDFPSSIGSPDFTLVAMQRRYFGKATIGGLVRRLLTIAPWLRATSGTSEVRVTLSPYRPRGDTFEDVVWSQPYSQVTFSSSTSTWATATSQDLDLRYLDAEGCCWIGIELAENAETRCIAQCRVKERT